MRTKLLLCFLYVSGTANAQWEVIDAFPIFSSTLCLTKSESVLYAGLNGQGVHKSQDNGETWVAANNGIFMGGAYIFSLASRNDSIYAGGFGEVSFSNNGGENWSLLGLSLPLNSSATALTVKDDYLFAGIGQDMNGVYRKELNGSGWAHMNNGLPANAGVRAFLTVNNSLFVGTDLGIYVSVDNGLNWISASEGVGSSTSVGVLHLLNDHLLAGTQNGIFFSSDQGNTWNQSTGLPTNADVTGIAHNNNLSVAATSVGAFASTDSGNSWYALNDGLSGTPYLQSITSMDAFFFAGWSRNILRLASDELTSAANSDKIDGDLWSVYPNPFSNEAVLELKYPVINATLTVYNVHGQVVKHIDKISENRIVMNRDNLPSGQYFVQLVQGNQVIATNKLVVTDK